MALPALSTAYYLTPDGRISRAEYWLYFYLPSLVLSLVLGIIIPSSLGLAGSVIRIIPSLIFSIIGGMRRFHDRDKSGWWLLLYLLPIIGWIWMFVELGFLKGTTGPNKFGDDPVS